MDTSDSSAVYVSWILIDGRDGNRLTRGGRRKTKEGKEMNLVQPQVSWGGVESSTYYNTTTTTSTTLWIND